MSRDKKGEVVKQGIVVWDDYNQRFPIDQDVMGTITTNIGSSTPRNGIKLIEVLEPKIRQMGRGFNKGGEHAISPTITSNSFECNNFVIGSMQKNAYKGTPMVGNSYRIRKLTPRECFRLMGVDDADIDKIQAAGISNSQQYKMAGNSIVVDNLYHIFRALFVDKPTKQVKQLTLF